MSPKKKEASGKRSVLLRNIIFTKLKSIKKEKFGPKTIDKFSLTIRVFLLRYLNLNYEFTIDELINELNKRKVSKKLSKRIISILNLITEVKYENRNLSKEEFKSLLEETESIINVATGKTDKNAGNEQENVKKGLLTNFLHKIGAVKIKEEIQVAIKLKDDEKKKKLEEIKKQQHPIIPESMEPLPQIGSNQSNIHLIKKKIYEGKVMLQDLNMVDAKKIYVEIIKIYISLDPKEQANVYNDVVGLYDARKSKENINREKIKLF